jgi:hypothetical protein
MADCDCLQGCIFFNDKMAEIPVTAERLKARYCKGDNTECARHMIAVAKGKSVVPTDLFPHDIERAKKILVTK